MPQLILPFAFDQFDNGQRVQRLGAGSVVPAARASARRLRQEITRLLARGPALSIASAPEELSAGQGLSALVDSIELALGSRRL